MESPSPTNQPTAPVVVLQTILHKPYEAIKALAEWLKENTLQYIIGEHPADEKVKTTHCHILIEGLKVSREALRKQVIKYSPGQGQNATMAKSQRLKLTYTREHLAKYIVKGNVNHVKSSSFNDVEHARWASLWIFQAESKSADHVAVATALKKKPNTIYDDCSEIADRITWTKVGTDYIPRETRQEILGHIIQWANEKRKALHSIQVANYFDVVLQLAVPESYRNLCIESINRRHRV